MIDEKTIAELRARHADAELHVLTSASAGIEAVFHAPARVDWRRFRQAGKDDRFLGLETLAKACVVYVEGQAEGEREAVKALDKLFDRRPGLTETWGGELAEIGGLEEVTAKKL